MATQAAREQVPQAPHGLTVDALCGSIPVKLFSRVKPNMITPRCVSQLEGTAKATRQSSSKRRRLSCACS